MLFLPIATTQFANLELAAQDFGEPVTGATSSSGIIRRHGFGTEIRQDRVIIAVNLYSPDIRRWVTCDYEPRRRVRAYYTPPLPCVLRTFRELSYKARIEIQALSIEHSQVVESIWQVCDRRPLTDEYAIGYKERLMLQGLRHHLTGFSEPVY